MKLDLILENVRNKYNMGLLEESSLTELDVLKGKVMINESTMQIRKMLVEEGTMEDVKSFLEESWSYELYEEALQLDTPKKVDTFIRRSTKALSTPSKDTSSYIKNGALIGAPIGAFIGSTHGGQLPSGQALGYNLAAGIPAAGVPQSHTGNSLSTKATLGTIGINSLASSGLLNGVDHTLEALKGGGIGAAIGAGAGAAIGASIPPAARYIGAETQSNRLQKRLSSHGISSDRSALKNNILYQSKLNQINYDANK